MSPLIKFLTKFENFDLEKSLAGEDSSGACLTTLLEFMTVYDFHKLRRLSSLFYGVGGGNSNLPLLKNKNAAIKHLMNQGQICEHPSAFRAALYSHRLLDRPKNPAVKKFLDAAASHVDTSYYTVSERLKSVDLSRNAKFVNNGFSES